MNLFFLFFLKNSVCIFYIKRNEFRLQPLEPAERNQELKIDSTETVTNTKFQISMTDFDRPPRRNRKLTEAGPRKSQRLSSLAGPAEVYRHAEISQQLDAVTKKEKWKKKGEKRR